MFSLFEFAVGVRLLMFVVFVACVYGGNALFVHLEHRKTKFLWKLAFVTLYQFFSSWSPMLSGSFSTLV